MSGQEGFTDKIKSFFGSKESLAEFEGLSTNADRIQFLYRHPFVQTLFKTQVGEAKERGRPHGKSDCEAKRQRELGNQAFKSGNDKKALQFYNEAIIFANGNPAIITSPSSNKQSLEFAYSAANRSAALFRLARYQEALRDVDSALKANHPKPEKLWERKLRCLTELGPCSPDEMEATWSEAEANLKTDTLQALKKQIDLQSVHKCPPELLRGPARNFTEGKPSVDPAEIVKKSNENFPGFSDAIEVHYSSKLGRFGVASRDITIGEVLLVEPPTASVLKTEEAKDHCENCFREKMLHFRNTSPVYHAHAYDHEPTLRLEPSVCSSSTFHR